MLFLFSSWSNFAGKQQRLEGGNLKIYASVTNFFLILFFFSMWNFVLKFNFYVQSAAILKDQSKAMFLNYWKNISRNPILYFYISTSNFLDFTFSFQ